MLIDLLYPLHDRVDDVDVGKRPLVARVLKGAYHARPSLPHYTTTWNVQVVLDGISKWGDTTLLSLKLLTYVQAGQADGINQAIMVGRSGSSFCK